MTGDSVDKDDAYYTAYKMACSSADNVVKMQGNEEWNSTLVSVIAIHPTVAVPKGSIFV